MTNFPAIFLITGVALLSMARCSEIAETNEEAALGSPTQNLESGQSKLNSPEVVLKVNYEAGIIDGIYVAQYRKSVADEMTVPDRSLLCQDLCHAGLGGKACGTACHDMIPVGLVELTSHSDSTRHVNTSDDAIGHPRMAVCTILCENNLGEPLCSCGAEESMQFLPSWQNVCNGFCKAYKYTPRGCPSCDQSKLEDTSLESATRVLDTYDGWMAWCDIQCKQGEGGAACNCDRSPF